VYSDIGNVYGPSTSAPLTVTVGTTPASTIPENPLPTSYWQEPVEAFNHLWYVLNGNWLGTSAINFGTTGIYGYQGNVNPYTQPVLTAHILWTKPVTAGGQMGGPFNGTESSNFYTGMQYQPKFAPIILNGVLYYTNYPGANTNPEGWTAVDLRTGQVIWTKNTTDILLCGEVVDPQTLDEYGGFSYLWAEPYQTFLQEISGAPVSLDLYDAQTGNYILTITNAIVGTKIVDSHGDLLFYYVNSSATGQSSLTMWNSTQALISAMPFFNTGMVVYAGLWTPPQNGIIPFSAGIQWSTPLPSTYNGAPISLGIATIDQTDKVIVLDYGAGLSLVNGVGAVGSQPGWNIETGYSIAGSGPATQLWITNRTLTPYTSVFVGPSGNGVYCEETEELMEWSAYNINTGTQVWGPTEPYSRSLGYYQFQTSAVIYGDNLYVWTFGGQIYDYNLTNGNVIWVFSTPSAGENNPYGVNPFWAFGTGEATLAGGVIYAATGHNYGPPLFNGAQIYAINASTGCPIFSFLNFATMSSLPVVDGEMLSLNCYDNQIYAYGKGNTATTVTVSPGQNSNSQALIKGTVTDQSPGQTCLGIPEAGTPAIADAYMSQWMEYLFEQCPEPLNATGVKVTLTDIDPNNNTYTIGTTTSDINGQYKFVFTPNVPGVYTIIATFGGSNSYYSSSAETSYLYETPSTPVPTAAPVTGLASTGTVELGIAAVIIVIVIIGAVLAILTLRKRP
jgi:outer membrane protein assembly factor BamB